MPPFLEIAEFTTEFGRALTAGEQSQAERLLTVVSDDIRSRKPNVDEDAAAQVVFEVVRDAIKYGDLEKFSSFQNITSRRQEAGTFDDDAKTVDDYLNRRQKKLLGIAVTVAARGSFKRCDY